MKDIYDIFIKSAKNRDYESVAWILNYVDAKALHDLICEENSTSDANNGSITIWQTKNEFISIYWDISSGYITIGVKYSKDNNNSVTSLIRCLYPKFPSITLSIDLKDSSDSFSINRCCPLEDCISTKFEKTYESPEEVRDEITKSVIKGILEEMSDDEIEEYNGGKY